MSTPQALPKYVQASEMLIREIASGRLMDGERLPPEREMAADLDVAVGTLRKALGDLERRGLLERRQGSGNYIRSGAEATGVYAFFRLELHDGGGLPTADVMSVDLLPKPLDAPDFGPAPKAHRIRRLRKLSERPAAIEEIWLDGARAATIRRKDLTESLYLYYRQSLGFWIARAEDSVSFAPVPEWAPDDFGPASGAICGYVERVARDQDNRAVEYSRTWFDTSVCRYVARLK